jgi:hypothetical protein
VPFSNQVHESDRVVPYDAQTKIIRIVITIDNIGEIVSSTESLKAYIADARGVICFSVDDLIVYYNNFKRNQALFLHYLKTRSEASNVARLFTYDEMDHLDSYCGNTSYPEIAKAYSEAKYNYFVNMGSGCEMDTTREYLPTLPDEYVEIFNVIATKSNPQILAITSFLMGFSFKERQYIAKCIVEGRQQSRKHCHAVSFRNDSCSPVGLFVIVCDGGNLVDEFKTGCIKVASKEMKEGLHVQFGVLTLIYNNELDNVEYCNVV